MIYEPKPLSANDALASPQPQDAEFENPTQWQRTMQLWVAALRACNMPVVDISPQIADPQLDLAGEDWEPPEMSAFAADQAVTMLPGIGLVREIHTSSGLLIVKLLAQRSAPLVTEIASQPREGLFVVSDLLSAMEPAVNLQRILNFTEKANQTPNPQGKLFIQAWFNCLEPEVKFKPVRYLREG